MILYYSQTITSTILNACLFQYLMKLYYSQTVLLSSLLPPRFQYLMKLHYSQTSNKLRHYNAQGNNIRYIYYTI